MISGQNGGSGEFSRLAAVNCADNPAQQQTIVVGTDGEIGRNADFDEILNGNAGVLLGQGDSIEINGGGFVVGPRVYGYYYDGSVLRRLESFRRRTAIRGDVVDGEFSGNVSINNDAERNGVLGDVAVQSITVGGPGGRLDGNALASRTITVDGNGEIDGNVEAAEILVTGDGTITGNVKRFDRLESNNGFNDPSSPGGNVGTSPGQVSGIPIINNFVGLEPVTFTLPGSLRPEDPIAPDSVLVTVNEQGEITGSVFLDKNRDDEVIVAGTEGRIGGGVTARTVSVTDKGTIGGVVDAATVIVTDDGRILSNVINTTSFTLRDNGLIEGDVWTSSSARSTIDISGGEVREIVARSSSGTTIDLTGGTIGAISAQGATTLSISENSIVTGNISLSESADKVTIAGGTINGDIDLAGGDDELTFTGGVLGKFNSRISGGAGNNTLNILGAKLNPPHVFTDWNQFNVDNGGSVQFAVGNHTINELNVQSGASLSLSGGTTVISPSTSSSSTFNLAGTLNMVNASTDVLEAGTLNLNGGTIQVEVDAAAGTADAINAQILNGTGKVQVTLLNATTIGEEQRIPIVTAQSGDAQLELEVLGSATDGLALVSDGNGGFILVVSPTSTSTADARAIGDAVGSAFAEFTKTKVKLTEGFLSPEGPGGGIESRISPYFTVFAGGRLGYMKHDGYQSTRSGSGGADGSRQTADLTARESSLFASAAVDLGRYMQLKNVGVKVGLFGGYAKTDVEFGPIESGGELFNSLGSGDNESFFAGTYSLFTSGNAYYGVAGSVGLGESNINNAVIKATSNYDTKTVVVAGLAGYIVPLGTTPGLGAVNLDLRGGLSWAYSEGAAFIDTKGNRTEKATDTFFKGVSSARLFSRFQSDGWTIEPYIQLGLEYALDRETRVILEDGTVLTYAESKPIGYATVGVTTKVSDQLQLFINARGDLADDRHIISGQVGAKWSLN
ncbi:MAG: autotransporter outer membrane beta-barrel domain-containing protein [Hyphomicrobiaceae bacterium]